MSKEAMKLALESLENSVDLVREDAYQTEKLYGNYPTRQGKINGLKVLADDHEKAITALREALEQPAQKCSYPYCGCNSKAWCKVERNEALDKKAENARELGLDYEPAQQEPYCYTYTENGEEYFAPPTAYVPDDAKPLYTSPPAQRTWVGLTDEEYAKLAEEFGPFPINQIEAKLKEKNT